MPLKIGNVYNCTCIKTQRRTQIHILIAKQVQQYIWKAYVWQNDELHKGIQSTLLIFSKYGDRTGNLLNMPN